MSWLFSQALVEEYSEGICSDGEPFAQLNVMPTPHKFWRNDKTIDCSSLSRFGLTLRLLTEAHGGELLMSYLAGFHARTSAQQEKGLGSTESEADCGGTWQGSFAKFDLDSFSWKTVQYSLLGGSDEFSGIWPRWGSMRSGVLYLRPIPARTICENESGLWQTPVADDTVERKSGKWNSRGEPKLSAEVKLFPTPCARDYRGIGRSRLERTGSKAGECLPQVVGGLLNPTWVEWLMGWPIGWTELEPLEMGKFQEWRQQHGVISQMNLRDTTHVENPHQMGLLEVFPTK